MTLAWQCVVYIGKTRCGALPVTQNRPRHRATLNSAYGKDTETVVNALIKHAQKLPRELYKSLTWDRGKEMAGHPAQRSYQSVASTG